MEYWWKQVFDTKHSRLLRVTNWDFLHKSTHCFQAHFFHAELTSIWILSAAVAVHFSPYLDWCNFSGKFKVMSIFISSAIPQFYSTTRKSLVQIISGCVNKLCGDFLFQIASAKNVKALTMLLYHRTKVFQTSTKENLFFPILKFWRRNSTRQTDRQTVSSTKFPIQFNHRVYSFCFATDIRTLLWLRTNLGANWIKHISLCIGKRNCYFVLHCLQPIMTTKLMSSLSLSLPPQFGFSSAFHLVRSSITTIASV